MHSYRFRLNFDVRDYECDMIGIVNHAIYLHYLEHARHLFLKEQGVDFAALTTRGIHMVAIRVELDYLHPLRSGDQFFVGVNIERASRLRFCFFQDIFRLPDDQPIVRAKVIGTVINQKGRPQWPAELAHLIDSGLRSQT